MGARTVQAFLYCARGLLNRVCQRKKKSSLVGLEMGLSLQGDVGPLAIGHLSRGAMLASTRLRGGLKRCREASLQPALHN